jgi:hypothetical protein
MSKHGMTSRHASQVKRGGHLREQIFSNQFTDSSMNEINISVNYTGSSADCFISNPEYTYIINELGAVNGTTSVKGGSNFQFHLGRIPELIDVPSLDIIKVQSSKGKLETRFSSNITEKSQLEASYEETSFADANLGYFVITYQAKKEDQEISQVVVYIRPDNNSIHQIYISGKFNPENEGEKKQLLWMHDKGCTIITSNELNSGSETPVTEKLIWQ